MGGVVLHLVAALTRHEVCVLLCPYLLRGDQNGKHEQAMAKGLPCYLTGCEDDLEHV